MSIVEVALTFFCFASLANALVLIPDDGLRPPKRPPPPPPPTLPPLPYAAAKSSPVSTIPRVVPVSPIIPNTRFIPIASVIPVDKFEPEFPIDSLNINGPLRVVNALPVAVPRVEVINNPLSQSESKAPVFRDEVKDKNGQFEIRHSDGKGTLVNESGKLISTDDGWEYVIVKEGDYSFTSPEGSPVLVKYVADEKGVKTSYSIRSQ